MTIDERALHVLIHDLRSPIGVAQGYLRMLREDRLPTPEARLRAITQAQQALDQVARLCDDAAAVADSGPAEARRVLVPCERLVGSVRARLEREPVAVDAAHGLAGHVAVAGDADALADAVARVLLATPVHAADRRRCVTIGASADEVWFTSGGAPDAGAGAEFDCWRGGGFALPLACRTIAGAGGRVWSASGQIGAGVAFPVEVMR